MRYIIGVCLSLLLLGSCAGGSAIKTVNVFIDPAKSGWYFISLDKIPSLKDGGIDSIKFKDSTRMGLVKIKDLNLTKFVPYDYHGNMISERLKLVGVKTIAKDTVFFEFYNPTQEELQNIKQWNASDDRAFKITLNENAELHKQWVRFKH